MAKEGLSKNKKIIIGVSVGIGVIGLGYLIYRGVKKKQEFKNCQESGGNWDADAKKCIGGSPVIANQPISNNSSNTQNISSGGDKTTFNNNASPVSMTPPSGSSPFASLPNGASKCERYVQNHDAAWNYVKCGGTWYTQRKGTTGWTSLTGITTAIAKLEAYSGS